MPLLKVDDGACTRCALCSRACPLGIVSAEEGELPSARTEREEACIACGHCVAVCPTAALSHERIPLRDCVALEAGWRLSPSRVEPLIRGRRSIRRYRTEPVDRSVIGQVLDTARFAPTGLNAQPVRWLVVHDPAEVRRLAAAVVEWFRELVATGNPMAQFFNAERMIRAWEKGSDPILRGAPHVVVAYGAEGDPLAPGACMIALSTLELSALPFGLGTCWAGYLQIAATHSPAVREALGLPAGHAAHGMLMLGTPEFEYARIPPRRPAAVTWR